MPSYFTHYWQREDAPVDDASPTCTQAFSSQFRKRGVRAGDRVFFLSYYSKRPFLVGALTVGKDPEEVENGFERIEAVPNSGSVRDFTRPIPLGVAKSLVRADTGIGLKFTSDGVLDSQTLRGVQKITAESAQLLEQLLHPSAEYGETMEDAELVATEGNLSLRLHLQRERDQKIIAAKRRRVLSETGSLACSVCKFDFRRFYGDLGAEFCEVHHLRMMGGSQSEVQTRLEDLAVVCSNCHRMLHRGDPLLTIEQLKTHIRTAAVSDRS